MDQLLLFTDGRMNVQSSIEFDDYLVVKRFGLPLAMPKAQLKVKSFEDPSLSKLELQTIFWPLDDLN